MKLKKWEIVLIVLVFSAALTGAALEREEAALSEKLIRLHVVANSDTEADQREKLMVRDAVLTFMEPLLSGAADRGEAAERIQAALPRLEALAEEVSGRAAEVTLEKELLPTTDYPTFSLPAGEYLSLRIRLGQGRGHNWWCVLFPRLCGEELSFDAGNLTEEELEFIQTAPVIKFKSLELLAELKKWLSR